MNPLYLLPFFFTLSFAQLILYEAGANPMQLGPVDGAKICPNDFPDGISIQCTGLPGATYTDFSVDGKQVRRERSRPYFLAGDSPSSGFVKPWSAPIGKTVEISCVGSNAISHSATVTLSCQAELEPTPEPEPTPQVVDDLDPATMVFVEAGRNGETGPVLRDDLTFCPDSFSSGKYSIFCKEGPGSAKAKFFVDGKRVKADSSIPFHINRDFKGRIKPWVAPEGFFEVECRLNKGMRSKARVRVSCEEDAEPSDEKDPSDEDEPMIKTKPDGCILIDSRISPLSKGWKETDEGVIFREGDTSLGIVGKGLFPLEYKFTPPVTSHYAVVVDMTTEDGKDYNDIWIKVDGNFNLIKKGVVKAGGGNGWIKGYHNANGRAALISSVDFDAHSISTRATLQEGVEYTFGISGRSTMVEVHRIILFPCGRDGAICQKGDKTWKKFMVSCAGVANP